MEPGKILVRAVFAYVFIVAILRLSGKRVVAEATTFDFVLALILGDLFDDLLWAEVSAAQFVVAAATLVMLEIATSAGSYLSPALARAVDGPRQVFLRDGAPVRKGMRRARLSERDVEMLLRQGEGLERGRWAEVRAAALEKDGEASIVKHEWAREAQKRDAERVREVKR